MKMPRFPTRILKYPGHRLLRVGLALAFAMIPVFTSFGSRTVVAAAFNVTKPADTNDGDCAVDDCSLREAIVAANASPGEDTIYIPDGEYKITRSGTGEDGAATGDLDITDNLVIQGESQGLTIIDANHLDRAFHIVDFDVSVSMSDLTITHGWSPGLESLGGGGILNSGHLSLYNVTIQDSRASRGAGLRYSFGVATLDAVILNNNTADSEGGGVYNNGEISLSNSFIEYNTAIRGGGIGNSEIVVLNKVIILGNIASEGGGIYNDLTLQLTDVTLSDNSAIFGGGIYNKFALEMERTTLNHNDADQDGGGLFNTVNKANLLNVTFSDNIAYNDGGGVFNQADLNLLNTTIYANIGTIGGGLYNDTDGNSTMQFTIVANNTAYSSGDNCYDGSDLQDQILSQGYNIEDTDECEFTGEGDLTLTDPLLGPLQNNGGWTATRAPAFDVSPAIDIGTGYCAEVDQRLVLRPVDGNGNGFSMCESGAVEVVTSGYLAFDPLVYNVSEDGGTVTVSVARPEGTQAVSVSYVTTGGNARPGSDYLPTSGVLSWDADVTTPMSFTITILDDIFKETDETIGLVLSNPTHGAGIVSPNHRATVTILASDPEGPDERAVFLPTIRK